MKIYTQKQWEAEIAPYKKEINTTDFDNACQTFRQICSEIGELIEDENFKGGYDDMLTFYNHNAYKTKKGLQLAVAWAGCNDLCKYEAKKLGMESPEWWYKCWENKEN